MLAICYYILSTTRAYRVFHFLLQVLIMAIISFLDGTLQFSLAYFVPTIISSMGYSAVRTQLMSVPPYATTFVVSVTIAVLADRWGQRAYSLLFSGFLATAGYALFLTSTHTSALYGSIFLQTSGAFTGASARTTWNVNNVQPHYKRSAAIGITVAMANFGGILSTWIFDDPPRFTKATKINLAFSVGMCVLAGANRVWLVVQNKRKGIERAQRQRLRSEEEEEAERRHLGDDHPDLSTHSNMTHHSSF
jgi:nitrate/nitrite transporter NarK